MESNDELKETDIKYRTYYIISMMKLKLKILISAIFS